MPSVISETAVVGSESVIGHFCVIGDRVEIGSGCRIGHHVIIHADTKVGDACVIDDHAVVGKAPLRSRSMAVEPEENLPPLLLANRVVLGTAAILFRGASVGEDSLIADFASVREKTTIGEKSIVGRGVAVENEVTIGDRCKIEAGAFICAFSRIANDCFIAPEVTLTNDNFLGRTEERKKHYAGTTLRDGGRIGANATILPSVTIDTEGVVGAGSVVTKNVDTSTIVVGVPSHPLKRVPPEQQI